MRIERMARRFGAGGHRGTAVQVRPEGTRFYGSAVQRFNGSTVQRFNGSAVQRFWIRHIPNNKRFFMQALSTPTIARNGSLLAQASDHHIPATVTNAQLRT